MGRLRRRKRKYTWFPQIGFQGAAEENDNVVLAVQPPAVNNDGTLSDVTIFPLIPDVPTETPNAVPGSENLATFIGNEYFLRRIVGKACFHLSAVPASATVIPIIITIGCGFFIARDAGDTVAAGQLTGPPIGAASIAERKQNYGPLHLETTREPWIWRRTWTMSPRLIAASGVQVWDTTRGTGNLPDNTMQGSVAEGCHIDARTARRVGQDDRLYFAIQTCVMDTDNLTTGATTFPFGTLDVRILGALRRARNRSVF